MCSLFHGMQLPRLTTLQKRYRNRERDRDSYRRRDHSLDRRGDSRDEDIYRPGWRERRRSRDRDDDRDHRRRSRERDYRSRRDDSRDRARRRADDSADLRHKPRGDGSRDREVRLCARQMFSACVSNHISQASKPSTPPISKGATDDGRRAERLAKLEAWKQKQAVERERKQREAAAAGGAKNILEEIDKKSGALPTDSPTTPGSDAPPAPYAGKFDPKAIAKNAAPAAATPAVLGDDVAVPQSAKASATSPTNAQVQANKPSAITSVPSCKPPLFPRKPLEHRLTDYVAASLKAKGNVGGFGLGAKPAVDSEKPSARTLGFDEEESTRKKLERLPTPPLDEAKDANHTADVAADDDDDDDDDVDMHGETEEENAAAARAAAERREEWLQNESEKAQSQGDAQSAAAERIPNGDVETHDALNQHDPNGMEIDAPEEEVDPLDAFMSGLTESKLPKKPSGAKFSRTKQQQPEAIFGDELDVDVTAVGDGDADDFLAIANKARKKKDIPAVDHKKAEYEPFRKKFYTEPSDLAQMSEEEAANLRLELDGIKVRGVDVPRPVQKWSQCGLGVQTLGVIDKLGYEEATSIQAQAIPAIMSGRDVIGVAKTGSGKTIAFLIPMFRHIKDQRPLANMEGPIGLIMTPTRELATQVHKDCRPFLKALNLRAVCAYGGAPIKDQIADLKRGAEIIVCTPGRMIDLLTANQGRVTNLARVTYVVLDEADRMFDLGFGPQVMKIMANIRPDRQTVLFSATFPRSMEDLARKTLTKPIEIVVGGKSVVAPEITQIVEVRNEDAKFVRLLELLGNLYSDEANDDARALIFVDRQEAADTLLRELMRKGYPCMSIHGGKDQVDRDSTIQDFKAGIFPVLVATSVAARGLDVKQLQLVVNYDAPNHMEDYVHRAGRTGRAGNLGTAVTFLTEDQERYAVGIAKALKQSGQEVPEPVQKLVDSFLDKVKAGKEKASMSGFGGKGLDRLDQERDAARNRERKTYKTEEGEEEDDKEEKAEKGEEQFNKVLSSVQSANAAPLPGVPKGIDLDGKITVHKTERDPASASKNPLDMVGSAVADIHARLSRAGVMRSGVPIDNRGPDAGAFHATLEINDFPRKFPSKQDWISRANYSQRGHDGRLLTGRTWPRSSKRRARRSRRREASTEQAKSRGRERTRSCIFLLRARRSWL